jgi:hypothetical protein
VRQRVRGGLTAAPDGPAQGQAQGCTHAHPAGRAQSDQPKAGLLVEDNEINQELALELLGDAAAS